MLQISSPSVGALISSPLSSPPFSLELQHRSLMADEHHDGNPAANQSETNDEEPMIGPGPVVRRPKRPLQFERAFLDALPSAHM